MDKDKLIGDEAEDFLCQARKLGAKAVTFTGGGEPLVNKDTLKTVGAAKQLGFDIGFITNGLLLNNEAALTILEHCSWCRISLDSDCNETRIATHGLDDFDIIVKNIDRIAKFKKESNSECTIGTGYLTGSHTIAGMEGFVKISKELGVDYAQFRPFHHDKTDISKDYHRLNEKYSDDKFKVVASIHKYSRYSEEKARPYTKCYGVNFTTVIAADAEMYICCHMRGIKKYSLGNLRKWEMYKLWEHREEIFKTIDFHDCPPFCRCDEFNRVLFEIKQEKQHMNFL
jgi:MoaA/NifB/PqqE/SkfB family radical SAM enzyme